MAAAAAAAGTERDGGWSRRMRSAAPTLRSVVGDPSSLRTTLVLAGSDGPLSLLTIVEFAFGFLRDVDLQRRRSEGSRSPRPRDRTTAAAAVLP